MTATHRGSAPRPGAAMILDQLDMLVTGDPLLGWIDHRLDQRNSLTAVADEPRDRTACRGRPACS